MGCDIHMMVEVRRDDRWHAVDPVPPVEDADDDAHDAYWMAVRDAPHIIHDRHYRLFAALSNTRNYGGIGFIAPARGIPGDASPEYLRALAGWGIDAHSYSWHTLRQLQEFVWQAAAAPEPSFFDALVNFGEPDDVRIVFFFDN